MCVCARACARERMCVHAFAIPAIAFVSAITHLRINAPVKTWTMIPIMLCLSACVCIFACFGMRMRKCKCLNHNTGNALSVCVWACVNHDADASATAADLDVR